MVIVSTEVAMLIGGNSEPAYHLTVTALPSEFAATKNKRSAHLLQAFMQESLDIKPKRGVVRFEPVAEENLATNGVTALQEIEQLEQDSAEDEGFLRAISLQTRRSKKSSMPFGSERDKTPTPLPRTDTPSLFTVRADEIKDTKSTEASGTGRKRVRQRKSILAFFHW
jgi:Macrophage migration inhibitory factor (MIF)